MSIFETKGLVGIGARNGTANSVGVAHTVVVADVEGLAAAVVGGAADYPAVGVVGHEPGCHVVAHLEAGVVGQLGQVDDDGGVATFDGEVQGNDTVAAIATGKCLGVDAAFGVGHPVPEVSSFGGDGRVVAGAVVDGQNQGVDTVGIDTAFGIGHTVPFIAVAGNHLHNSVDDGGVDADGFDGHVVNEPEIIGGTGIVAHGHTCSGRSVAEADHFLLVDVFSPLVVGEVGQFIEAVIEYVTHREGSATALSVHLGFGPEAELQRVDVGIHLG